MSDWHNNHNNLEIKFEPPSLMLQHLIKIWRKHFTPSQTGIKFTLGNNQPYTLSDDSYYDIAYVYEDGDYVAVFESIRIRGSILYIDHYSVHHCRRGQRCSEKYFREFAKLISLQRPAIQMIEIRLSKPSFDDPIIRDKVANARYNLLTILGAQGVSLKRKNQNCIEVSGFWDKTKWLN